MKDKDKVSLRAYYRQYLKSGERIPDKVVRQFKQDVEQLKNK